MALRFRETDLPGVVVIEPQVFQDRRGFFQETFHGQKYAAAGIPVDFVQDNYSHSERGTLRGLHYQLRRPQGKLIYVVQGAIFDVCVDIRVGSSRFGHSCAVVISAEDHRQLYIPEGFAHGFCVLSETADVIYKCTDFYDPDDEYGVLWSDSALAVQWPRQDPLLSEKDRGYPCLADLPAERLPRFVAEIGTEN